MWPPVILALALFLGQANSSRQPHQAVVTDDHNEDFVEEFAEIDLDAYAPQSTAHDDFEDSESHNDFADEDFSESMGDSSRTEAETTILIMHCPSDDKTATFQEYANRIKHLYPKVTVSGQVTPSTFEAAAAYSAVAAIQYTLMAFCWMGRWMMATASINPPEFYASIEKSPMAPTMLVWMLGNRIKAQLLATGAFEVKINGQVAWSALEKNREPSWQELLSKLQEAGFDPIFGADDESMFPPGWAEKAAY